MLIDVLSPDSQVTFNLEIAKSFGDIYTAIHINKLMEIGADAIRRNADDNGYFCVDRAEVERSTLVSLDLQLTIEEKLAGLGVLTKRADGCILFDAMKLLASVSSCDEDLASGFEKYSKVHRSSSVSRKMGNISKLKNIVKDKYSHPEEIKDALYKWIEVVVEKFGLQSEATIDIAIGVVDKYADHNIDRAIGLIQYATSYGFLRMDNAVKSMNKVKTDVHSTIGEVEVKLGDKVY